MGVYFDFLLAVGGALVVRERDSHRVVGCSRHYVPPEAPQEIGIGYTFLVRDLFGGAANAKIKALMLAHAFAQLRQVWLHIDPTNIRSQRATAKRGARVIVTRELTPGVTPARWQRWPLTQGDFLG